MIQPAPVPSWGRAVERAERIRGSQNQNLLAEQRLKDYPKEEQWRAEQRGRQRTTWNREDEVYKREVERLKFKDEADALDYMIKSSPMINWQNYPDSRQHLLDMGLNPAALPEPEVIYNRAMEAGADPNQFFEAWKNKALMTGQQRLELIKKQADISARGYKPGTKEDALAFEEAKAGFKGTKWSAPKAGIDENGKQVFFQTNDKGESRLVRGVQPEPKKGMRVTTPDGTIVEIGGNGGTTDLTPKTKGTIEAKLMGGKEQLARMQAIYSEFKPEYQEIPTRLGKTWTSIKASFGQNIPKEDARSLTEFKKFQRKSIENINLYIKELTGAQMSVKEADRLRLAQPDPGEKWYSGDDPITFKAKMDDILKATRACVARYEYYKTKGLNDTQIKSIVNDNTAISLETLMEKIK